MTVPLSTSPSPQQLEIDQPVKFTLITSAPALTAVLSANLQAHVSRNDARGPAAFEDMTVFHALEAPAISVPDYVARVAKYAFCSEACLVAAFHYMNMAVKKEPKLALTSLSVHRMFITAVVLACKYFDDVSYNLMYYSKVGGLPYKELANLEVSMLRILNFRLDISAQKFMTIESQMWDELDACDVSRDGSVVASLVEKARSEISKADIVPVELECPSDDVDFALIVAEKEKQRRKQAKARASPATSACTEEDTSLTRNNSMASVTAAEMQEEDSEVKPSETADPRRKDVYTSISPTTPAVAYCHEPPNSDAMC